MQILPNLSKRKLRNEMVYVDHHLSDLSDLSDLDHDLSDLSDLSGLSEVWRFLYYVYYECLAAETVLHRRVHVRSLVVRKRG